MSTITEPGVYDIAEQDYHGDRHLAPTLGRSLSVSGAKTLLTDPARFLWERDNGRPPKDVFDEGTVAHELILHGGDARIRVIDAYDWKTKAAQEAKKAAHAARLVPVHRGTLLNASRVARAVRRNPLAAGILSTGEPEKSMFWVDPETGITCRGRMDWVRDNALVDVKTAAYGKATPSAFAKEAANFDYPMQAAHYADGWEVLTGKRVPFLFLVVEKEPPYMVRVHQLSEYDLEAGRERIRQARRLFAQYESDGYPDDSTDIHTLTLPAWYGRTN